MPKTGKANANGENVVAFNVNTLTADLRKGVAAVKSPILNAAGDWNNWTRKCKDIAPKVMKLFRAIAYHFDQIPGAKTFRFVDFCRLLDPATPERDYAQYKTYKTLQYMRLIDQQRNRATTAGTTQQPGGARSKALDLAARLLKSVATLKGITVEDALAQASTEMGFTKNIRTRMQQRIAAVKPLWTITISRGAAVLELQHAEPEPKAEPQAGGSVHVGGKGTLDAAMRAALAEHGGKAKGRKTA